MKTLSAILLAAILAIPAHAASKAKSSGGRLPAGWAKLDLTEAQHAAIVKTQADFKTKIDAAQKALDDLKDEQRAALLAHLTPEIGRASCRERV